MAYFNIVLNISDNNLELINCLFKYFILLTLFHFILCYSNVSFKNYSLTKNFCNEMYLNILVSGCLSIMFYHLIVKNLIEFTN